MSLLLVGISHRTAEVPVLERVAVSAEDTPKVLDDLLTGENITEAMVVSTCNRVEVYAVVETFHGGLTEVSQVLARHAHAEVSDLTGHLYVHYAGSAVEHLFSVAAGLDSMVVGEAQILGQLRAAYAEARELGSAGRTLHELAQQALRVGKRAHAETGIDAAGASVVSEALADAETALGGPGALAGRRALVIGAGSMGALSAAHLRRGAIGEIVLVNRSPENAERLAVALRAEGGAARAAGLDALRAELAAADVVVACTGAVGTVVGAEEIRVAVDVRRGAGRPGPMVICDLGLPRDIDPRAGEIDGVVVVDLAALSERLRSASAGLAVAEASAVVAEEVRAYFATQRSAEVTPTVTALRRRAAEVVDAELLRLDGRLPALDEKARVEVAQTVRRVVDKLLHTPTVQVKRLAQSPGGDSYAEALRELFELDPQTPAVLAGTESATSAPTPQGMTVEPGEVDSALAVDPARSAGGPR